MIRLKGGNLLEVLVRILENGGGLLENSSGLLEHPTGLLEHLDGVWKRFYFPLIIAESF